MNEISKTVDEIITVLGEKFGKTGESLWKAAIRQQTIDGYMSAFLSVAIAMAAFAALPALYHASWGCTADSTGWCGWPHTLAGLISSTIAIAFAWSAVTCLLNPEYAAIKDVISNVKGDAPTN